MARTTYQIDQYALEPNDTFVRIYQTFCDSQKRGEPPCDHMEIRRTFTVIHNLATGRTTMKQGPFHLDADRLIQLLITGIDPKYPPSRSPSRWFLLGRRESERDGRLFEAQSENTPHEWTEIINGAEARFAHVEELPEDARMRLEHDEQTAFGFGLRTYTVWHLANLGIREVPYSTERRYSIQ